MIINPFPKGKNESKIVQISLTPLKEPCVNSEKVLLKNNCKTYRKKCKFTYNRKSLKFTEKNVKFTEKV